MVNACIHSFEKTRMTNTWRVVNMATSVKGYLYLKKSLNSIGCIWQSSVHPFRHSLRNDGRGVRLTASALYFFFDPMSIQRLILSF